MSTRESLELLSELVQTSLHQNILCDHCLHDLNLYIRKMSTNREMVIFQKWFFFDFSLCFYYELCHYRSTTNDY